MHAIRTSKDCPPIASPRMSDHWEPTYPARAYLQPPRTHPPLAARHVRADRLPDQDRNARRVRLEARFAGQSRGRAHLGLAGLAAHAAVPAGRGAAVDLSVTGVRCVARLATQFSYLFDTGPSFPDYPLGTFKGKWSMTSGKTTKTLYYLRARRDSAPFDLQAIVARARLSKSNCGATEIELGGGDVVRIQHYSAAGGRLRLHLSRYVPGISTSTLQPKATSAEDDEGTQAPPRGKEFKEGDCFLLIKDHHVLYCGHGISKEKTTLYLSQLFRAANLHDESSGFDLVPASNLDKLKLIQDHGVRSIQLKVGTFDLSLPEEKRKNWMSKSFGKISDELSALVSKDQSIAEQKALEDLIVNVEVRLDGNTRAVQGAQDFIEDLAETVLADDETPISDFLIVTQDGKHITSSTIRLQTKASVETKDNSVSHNSVWAELGAYFDQIAQGNLLEQ